MSKLSLKTEEIRVLSSDELNDVAGGLHRVSSALKPTSTAVSSVKPGGHTVSSIKPTATAVSSAKPGHLYSSVKPNF